jgi:hypothetical protein
MKPRLGSGRKEKAQFLPGDNAGLQVRHRSAPRARTTLILATALLTLLSGHSLFADAIGTTYEVNPVVFNPFLGGPVFNGLGFNGPFNGGFLITPGTGVDNTLTPVPFSAIGASVSTVGFANPFLPFFSSRTGGAGGRFGFGETLAFRSVTGVFGGFALTDNIVLDGFLSGDFTSVTANFVNPFPFALVNPTAFLGVRGFVPGFTAGAAAVTADINVGGVDTAFLPIVFGISGPGFNNDTACQATFFLVPCGPFSYTNGGTVFTDIGFSTLPGVGIPPGAAYTVTANLSVVADQGASLVPDPLPADMTSPSNVFGTTPIPEPSTLLLFELGMAALGWRVRRRFARTSEEHPSGASINS